MSVETITNNATALETLQQLGQQGKGIRVAVIDGAIDHVHPLLSHLNIASSSHTPTAHGTAVCSLITGQGVGLAPEVEILSFPVFQENAQGEIQGCSERSIAKAIAQARKAQCDIINISAASLSPNGVGTQELREAVADCNADGILIVSAVGNEGRNSEAVPAALEGVLAVGACDKEGNPSAFNNYGSRLRDKMLLASGEEMPVAMSENNIAAVTGSSFATPIVSAICVLVYNALQLPKQNVITPKTLRTLLFETATLVPDTSGATNAEYSRLNVPALLKRVEQELSSNHSKQRSNTMSNVQLSQHLPDTLIPDEQELTDDERPQAAGLERQTLPATTDSIIEAEPAQAPLSLPKIDDPASNNYVHSQAAQVTAQILEQTDPNSVRRAEKVFVLGTIGYDFGSEARMDYFTQQFEEFNAKTGTHLNANLPSDMAEYLKADENANASKATGLLWTLKIDGIPVYAIHPENQYALLEYYDLVLFLENQYLSDGDKNKIERVSIAGTVKGEARLLNGHTVPVISPILRGMFSWSTNALATAVYNQDLTVHQEQKLSSELLAKQQELFSQLFNTQQQTLIEAQGLSDLTNELKVQLIQHVQEQQANSLEIFKQQQLEDIETFRSLQQESLKEPQNRKTIKAQQKVVDDLITTQEGAIKQLREKEKQVKDKCADCSQAALALLEKQITQAADIISKQLTFFRRKAEEYIDLSKQQAEQASGTAAKKSLEELKKQFAVLLDRIYYELRNSGLSDQERAINYAATNTYNIKKMLDDASKEDLTLNKISVEPSPICRPESICMDVVFEFFNPKKRLEDARKIYRSTVDVSDLIPVTIGELRHWYAY